MEAWGKFGLEISALGAIIWVVRFLAIQHFKTMDKVSKAYLAEIDAQRKERQATCRVHADKLAVMSGILSEMFTWIRVKNGGD